MVDVAERAQSLLRHSRTPEGKRDPERVFSEIRELTPIHKDVDSGMWHIFRWVDCHEVMRSPQFGAPHLLELEPRFQRSAALQFLADTLSNLDPPHHTRLRGAVQKSFTAPVLRKSEAHVRELIETALNALEDVAQFDVVADYAAKIPNTVICEMLGVPRADHETFAGWLNQQFLLLSPMPPPDEVVAQVDQATQSLLDYMENLIEERRREPRTDIISELVVAQEGVADPLSIRDITVTTAILLAGGSDTTKTAISIGVRQLIENPDQRALLLKQPELIKGAFEEICRTAGPVVLANARRALEPVTVAGVDIAEGEMLVPVLAAANFDPEKFEAPFDFNIQRSPNHHIAFGGGVHVCVGNMMARMVGGEAILALMRRFPDLKLVDDGRDVNVHLIALRGLNSLRVSK